MGDQFKESLSALMDGEAEELELRRLLTSESSEVDKQWARYHLARDVIQGNDQASHFQHLDISQQVAEAIRQEPVLGQQDTTNKWWKPMAGFAVAASVAMAVVVGVQSTQQVTPGLDGAPTSAQVVSNKVYPVQGASLQAADGAGSVVTYSATDLPGGLAASRAQADLEAQKRLDKYMLRHTERAALNNGQGMVSFARVASFETE